MNTLGPSDLSQAIGATAISNSSALQASMTHSPIQTPGGGNAAFVGLPGAINFSKEGGFVLGCFCVFDFWRLLVRRVYDFLWFLTKRK